jgi:hypothetical protein
LSGRWVVYSCLNHRSDDLIGEGYWPDAAVHPLGAGTKREARAPADALLMINVRRAASYSNDTNAASMLLRGARRRVQPAAGT